MTSTIKEEMEFSDYLSTSLGTNDSGVSIKSLKRRRSDSSYDSISDTKSEIDLEINTNKRTGRGIVVKSVDLSTKCLTHFNCRKISDDVRTAINQNFARLSNENKRAFISSSVVCLKLNNDQSGKYARKHSNEYHLIWRDEAGQLFNVTVCRSMFISTIGITPWTMRNWLGENLTLTQDKENQAPKKGSGKKSERKSLKVVKEEIIEQPHKKFKSMLLERYLTENNHL